MRKVGGVRRKREGMCKKIEFRGLVEERAQQQRALFPVLLAPANNSPALGPGPASAKAERLDVDAGDTGEGTGQNADRFPAHPLACAHRTSCNRT
jgi:hypothetical protein